MTETIAQVLAVVLGLCMGSFSTMLLSRLHFDEGGIIAGRSKCAVTGRRLRWTELVPVFSWLVQGGETPEGKRIPFFYPLVELSFAGGYFVFVQKFYSYEMLWPLLVAVTVGLWLFWTDVRWMEVDRRVSLPGIALALVWAFFREDPWTSYVLAGAVGYSFYAVQYYGSRGKWVGKGDLELGAFFGLVLGWPQVLLGGMIAYVLGSVIGIGLMLMRRAGGETPLPMGAFLLPGLFVMLYMGDDLWTWYMNLLGL